MSIDLFEISNEIDTLIRKNNNIKDNQPASVIGAVQGVHFYVELLYRTIEPPSRETRQSWVKMGIEDESVMQKTFKSEISISNWHGLIYPDNSEPIPVQMLDGFPKQRHVKWKNQRKLFNPATWLSKPTIEVSFGALGFTNPRTGEFVQTHFPVTTELKGSLESPLEPVLIL